MGGLGLGDVARSNHGEPVRLSFAYDAGVAFAGDLQARFIHGGACALDVPGGAPVLSRFFGLTRTPAATRQHDGKLPIPSRVSPHRRAALAGQV